MIFEIIEAKQAKQAFKSIETKMSLLKHITTVYANGRIPVHKYKSESTGLHVVIGEWKRHFLLYNLFY